VRLAPSAATSDATRLRQAPAPDTLSRCCGWSPRHNRAPHRSRRTRPARPERGCVRLAPSAATSDATRLRQAPAPDTLSRCCGWSPRHNRAPHRSRRTRPACARSADVCASHHPQPRPTPHGFGKLWHLGLTPAAAVGLRDTTALRTEAAARVRRTPGARMCAPRTIRSHVRRHTASASSGTWGLLPLLRLVSETQPRSAPKPPHASGARPERGCVHLAPSAATSDATRNLQVTAPHTLPSLMRLFFETRLAPYPSRWREPGKTPP
jgi:hypothetical protein